MTILMKPPSLMRILIVEDNAERIACFRAWKPEDVHFVLATSPGPALGIIQRDRGLVYAGVMLDHDLLEQSVCDSEIEFSGTQVASAIIANFSYEIPILIHSMNYSRALSMENKLIQADFSVTRIPMTLLTEQRLHHWLDSVRDNWSFTRKCNHHQNALRQTVNEQIRERLIDIAYYAL